MRGSATARTRPTRSLTGGWRYGRRARGCVRLAAQPRIITLFLGFLGEAVIILVVVVCGCCPFCCLF